MKVTINIEDRVIKGMVAIALLQEGDSIPEGLKKRIEEVEEIDITEALKEADENNQLKMALGALALWAIVDQELNTNPGEK